MYKLKRDDSIQDQIKFNHKKSYKSENRSKEYSKTSPLINHSDSQSMKGSNSNVLKNATSNVFFGEIQKDLMIHNKSSNNNTTLSNNSNMNLTNLIKNLDNNKQTNLSSNVPNFQTKNKTNQFYKSDSSLVKTDNYPSLVTPQVGLKGSSSDDGFNNNQMINLEDVCMLEEKLWTILEVLCHKSSV